MYQDVSLNSTRELAKLEDKFNLKFFVTKGKIREVKKQVELPIIEEKNNRR